MDLSFPVNLLTPSISTKEALSQICKLHGPDIAGDFISNKPAFLWALCGKETTFGVENWPKHEDAYSPCPLGIYFKKSKTLQDLYYRSGYGALVSCSWSPWQIMFMTAFERGFTQHPALLHSPMIAVPYVILQLNYLIQNGANTLELLAASWNAGPGVIKNMKLFPQKYVGDFMLLYNAASQSF